MKKYKRSHRKLTGNFRFSGGILNRQRLFAAFGIYRVFCLSFNFSSFALVYAVDCRRSHH